MKKILGICLALTLLVGDVFAAPLTSGNILVSYDNQIREYTTDGTLVQTIDVDYPGGRPSSERVRDIVVDDDGVIHAYNGTFDVYISSFDPSDELALWRHRPVAGLNTANNISFGGIAVAGSIVMATDQQLSGESPDSSGIVAVDLLTDTHDRFAEGTAAIDVNLGQDGRVLVLSPGGSPEGRTLDVYAAGGSFSLLDSIDLTEIFGFNGHRAVTADAFGTYYVADWDAELHRFAIGASVAVETIRPCADLVVPPTDCRFVDVDIDQNGTLALGTSGGGIVLVNSEFEVTSALDLRAIFRSARPAFVTFVPPGLGPVGPTPLDIDINPSSTLNRIDPNRARGVTVRIFTDDAVDAAAIDIASIAFGPAGASVFGPVRYRDFNGDGRDDLRVRFFLPDTGVACGDTEMSLSVLTVLGEEVLGADSIQTVNCN